MHRHLFLLASLSALFLGACSLTQSLDDLKENAGRDGGGGSSASGGSDAQAKLCEKGVDCTGCADCTTFCQCGAPPSGFDGCMVVCQGSGGSGDGGGSGGSAGTDGGAGASTGVDCGAEHCDPGDACCVTSTSVVCDNQCSGVTVSCDGPEDCGTGEVCCATLASGGGYSDFTCATGCSGSDKTVVCHDSQQCPSGTACAASTILADYSVCK